jgi:hypothetical protein
LCIHVRSDRLSPSTEPGPLGGPSPVCGSVRGARSIEQRVLINELDPEQLLDWVRPALSAVGIEVSRGQSLDQDASVADKPLKLIIEGRRSRPEAVVICARPADPAIVRRAVVRARQAAEMLGPRVGAVPLLPLADGTFGELSYVILPWHQPALQMGPRRVRRLWTAARVLGWLRDAVSVSARAADDVTRPRRLLERLAGDARFGAAVRGDARLGLERLDAGQWRPKTVLVHNDLWLGNVLLPARTRCPDTNRYRFFLIDWAAAEMAGYPFWDLSRLCDSFGVPTPWARREIGRHCAILGFEPQDALSSLLLAIAHLGAQLRYFPVERYVHMSELMHEYLKGLLATERRAPRADRAR